MAQVFAPRVRHRVHQDAVLAGTRRQRRRQHRQGAVPDDAGGHHGVQGACGVRAGDDPLCEDHLDGVGRDERPRRRQIACEDERRV